MFFFFSFMCLFFEDGTKNESSYVFVSFVPGFRNKGDPKLSTPGLTYDRVCVYPLLKVVM